MSPDQETGVSERSRGEKLRSRVGVTVASGWCEVDGCRVAWQAWGEQAGEAVVCLHPAGSGGRYFQPLGEHVPVGIRLIVLDWPGHGRSDPGRAPMTVGQCKDVLTAMVNQLGIARPFLLGAGLGAAVAIRFASEHARRVRGLVLVSPAGLLPGGKTAGRLAWVLRGRGRVGPAERQRLRESVVERANPGLYDGLRRSLEGGEEGLRAALGSIPCPALFAFSRDAKADPLKDYLAVLDPLLKTSGQHRFTVFAGSYSPVWDEPARFAQALTGFVQAQLPLAQHRHAWLLTATDWPATGTNLWKCVHPECSAERVLAVGEDANVIAPDQTDF